MDLLTKITLERCFRSNPNLAKSIHKGRTLESDLEKLSELSGINLNFLSINRAKIQSMTFDC